MKKTTLKLMILIILACFVGGCTIEGTNASYSVSYMVESDLEAFDTIEVRNGTVYTITTTEPTKNAYNFLGWATTKDATTVEYTSGEEIIITGNVKLYPIYNKVGYALTKSWFKNSYLLEEDIYSINIGLQLPNQTPTYNWSVCEGINAYAYNADNGLYNVYVCAEKDLPIYFPEELNSLFLYFENCISITFGNINTSNVTDMSGMFSYCNSLTSLNLTNFNTSKVINMSGMFYNCTSLKSLDLSSFDTSNVTDFANMFFNCNSLTSLNLTSFNTLNLTNVYNMFYNCNKLTTLDLSSFVTSNVTMMSGMFCKCSSLSTIYVSNATTWIPAGASTVDMFSGCKTNVLTEKTA